MGLNNNKSSGTNKTYLNIVGGKITRRYKEHQPEENGKPVTFSREITDKNTGEVKKTVVERYYDSIDGSLQAASIDNTGSFGSMLVFDMIDNGEEFTLSIPLDSSYGRAILLRIPNIDPNITIEFSPFNFESDNEMKDGKPKKIVGCNVFQKDCGWDKDKVPAKWNKENPGSLPQWVKSETTGKWDSTAQLEFLGQHFLQWASKVGGVPTDEPNPMEMEQEFAQEQAAKANTPPPPTVEDAPVDDLPF